MQTLNLNLTVPAKENNQQIQQDAWLFEIGAIIGWYSQDNAEPDYLQNKEKPVLILISYWPGFQKLHNLIVDARCANENRPHISNAPCEPSRFRVLIIAPKQQL